MPYNIVNCDLANLFAPYLASNKIYIPVGTEVTFTCTLNGTDMQLSLKQWQSYGLDIGTTVETIPDVETVIQWGREMLQQTD